MFFIPKHLITTVISASAIIIGSLIGAWFSWIISKKTTEKSIEEQYKILDRNVQYEEVWKKKDLCKDANIVRLDICTVVFQSIRTLKKFEEGTLDKPYPIPINKNYACSVSNLSNHYFLKEISYIYQLYGFLEKLNHDVLNSEFLTKESEEKLIPIYEDILKSIYGENYKKILTIDIDRVSYDEIYNNAYIKDGFRKVLDKLDKLCNIEDKNNF